jgi:hypothetical protein
MELVFDMSRCGDLHHTERTNNHLMDFNRNQLWCQVSNITQFFFLFFLCVRWYQWVCVCVCVCVWVYCSLSKCFLLLNLGHKCTMHLDFFLDFSSCSTLEYTHLVNATLYLSSQFTHATCCLHANLQAGFLTKMKNELSDEIPTALLLLLVWTYPWNASASLYWPCVPRQGYQLCLESL